MKSKAERSNNEVKVQYTYDFEGKIIMIQKPTEGKLPNTIEMPRVKFKKGPIVKFKDIVRSMQESPKKKKKDDSSSDEELKTEKKKKAEEGKAAGK